MKKVAIIISIGIVMAAFFSPLFAQGKARFVASNYSDRYHLESCKVAQKIPPEELVVFAAPEEALAASLVPCKKCYPPTSSKMGD